MESETTDEVLKNQIRSIINEIPIKEYKKYITISLERYCFTDNQTIRLPTLVVLNFAKMLLILSKNIQHSVISDVSIDLEKYKYLCFSILSCPELIVGSVHVTNISVFIYEDMLTIDLNLRECVDDKIDSETKESEITKTFMNISDVVNIFMYNALIYLLPDNTWDTIKSYPTV